MVGLVVVDRQNLSAVLPGESVSTLPCMAGFTVIASVDHAAKFLSREKIGFLDRGGRIIVSARDAGGSAVVFERGL